MRSRSEHQFGGLYKGLLLSLLLLQDCKGSVGFSGFCGSGFRALRLGVSGFEFGYGVCGLSFGLQDLGVGLGFGAVDAWPVSLPSRRKLM